MSKEGTGFVPHYALPNASTEAAMYVNREADMVKESFQTGNFRSIAMLPTGFRCGTVLDSSANHIDANITSAIYHAPHGSYKVFGKNRVFQEFAYTPSQYNLADQLRVQEAEKKEEKRKEVHTAQFVYSSPFAGLKQDPNRPLFNKEEEPKYVEPFHAAKDAKLRDQWLSQSKVLAGPFLPNTEKIMSNTHSDRGRLPDMMRTLATLLDRDWEDCEFQIYRDEQDLIVMEFDLETVDSEKGLLTYINNIITNNAELAGYALSKVPELWAHSKDGSIYYALKPSWVSRETTLAYYTLHPERRNFTAYRAFMKEQAKLEAQKKEEEGDNPLLE